jgi:hypothetical protein
MANENCKLCGCDLKIEECGKPCNLAGLDCCESCHDNLYETFNIAEFEANLAKSDSGIKNKNALNKWHFDHMDKYCMALKGDVKWAINGKINVMWVTFANHDCITIQYTPEELKEMD